MNCKNKTIVMSLIKMIAKKDSEHILARIEQHLDCAFEHYKNKEES